jgi:hypothetical protein
MLTLAFCSIPVIIAMHSGALKWPRRNPLKVPLSFQGHITYILLVESGI